MILLGSENIHSLTWKKKIICRVDSINKKVNTVSTSAKFEESILAVLYDLYRSESKNLYHLT